MTWNPTEIVPTRGPFAMASMDELWDWGEVGFFASTDGGDEWGEVDANLDLSQSISQFDFVDEATGWAISQDASGKRVLYQSLDGGKTWQAPGSAR